MKEQNKHWINFKPNNWIFCLKEYPKLDCKIEMGGGIVNKALEFAQKNLKEFEKFIGVK